MYPAQSDWTSATPGSGWFVHRVLGQPTSVCGSTGWDTLADLQIELQSRLSATPLMTYTGDMVDAIGIVPNDPTYAATPWNVTLLRALYAVAKAANAPGSYLAAIQSDANRGTGPISTGTLQTGIWIGKGYYSGAIRGTGQTGYGVGSPNEVSIPDNTVYPSMDVAPPVPIGGVSSGAVCNVAPANIDTLVPVNFSFGDTNTWIAIGVLAVAAVAVVVAVKDTAETRGGTARVTTAGSTTARDTTTRGAAARAGSRANPRQSRRKRKRGKITGIKTRFHRFGK